VQAALATTTTNGISWPSVTDFVRIVTNDSRYWPVPSTLSADELPADYPTRADIVDPEDELRQIEVGDAERALLEPSAGC
jgi:hypothetical protein